jgi:hypothetical protein
MTYKHLLFTLFIGCITTASAAEPTPVMLGNLKASLHQICGNEIIVQVAEMTGSDEGRTILGLKNNKTGKVDLFTSINTSNKQYDKYQPVNFDNLSQSLIPQENDRPAVVWGGAITNLKGMEYSLALGSHVYSCTKLAPFESEIANDLYGEKDVPAH